MVVVPAVRRTPAPASDGMDVQAMTVWLTAFGNAWERSNADATAALFAPGATFQPSPFGELVRGRSRIAAHWAEVMSGQQAIRFQGEILGVGTTYGIAHWRVVIGQTTIGQSVLSMGSCLPPSTGEDKPRPCAFGRTRPPGNRISSRSVDLRRVSADVV
jgi:hypothetical protein